MNTEDQYLLLKKDFNIKENEWKKDKAVYTQKIYLLELQLEEHRCRENNQKQLNDTIMSALNDVSKPQNKVYKDLLQTLETQSKDNRRNDTIREVESQYRQLKGQYDDQESNMKDLQFKYEKEILQYKLQIESLQLNSLQSEKKFKDNEKVNDLNVEHLQKQCKQDINQLNMQFKSKLDETNILMEQNYQQQIQQLVNSQTQEKDQLNQRIIKCQNLIKKYQTHLDSNRSVQEIENVYQLEISKLKQLNDQRELQSEQEKKQLLEQINDGNRVVQCLEEQIMKSKRFDDQLRSSQVLKENINTKYTSAKKNSNNSLMSKIDIQSYSPINAQKIIQVQFLIREDLHPITQCINWENLKLPDHIQTLTGRIDKNSDCFTSQPQDKYTDRSNNSLPMSIDQFNILKKKRMHKSSTLQANQTQNFNEKSGTSSQIDSWQQNNDQSKQISNQITKRQNSENNQLPLMRTELTRGVSQNSISQLNNILGIYDNVKQSKITDFNRSLEDIIMETSLEQNKDTEQGGYYLPQDSISSRPREYSQKNHRTHGSGIRVTQEYQEKQRQNQSYIHETFNPLLTTENTQRMNEKNNNTSFVKKTNPRYSIDQEPLNGLEQMDLSSIEKNLKEQIMLMNTSSQASNDSQVNQEIKYLIGKLLKAKAKLTEGLNKSQNKSQSMSMLGKTNISQNQIQHTTNNSFYAQHRKTNQSTHIISKTIEQNQIGGSFLQKPRHLKIRSSNFSELD